MRDKEYWSKTWDLFRGGDRRAYEEIYSEFLDTLFAYGTKITKDRELVKDCIQDLFISLYKYGKRLNSPEHIEYYLYSSLRRTIFNRLKKENRLVSISEDDLLNFQLEFDLENEFIHQESINQKFKSIRKILAELDSSKRELLYLKFYTGLNYREIGDLLGMKQDTVKKQVYRLLESLQIKFGAKLMELFLIFSKT